MKIILDTNCLLPAVFPRSIYHWIWKSFRRGDFILLYSNDIISEYEELLSNLYPLDIVENAIQLILASQNIEKVTPYFKWNLISFDPEDNKFVDCALNAGADYIVTNDKHFNNLKDIDFPPIKVIGIEEFKNLLKL
jgi:putative PIN family toxin of toxin-antitoxin system